MVEYKDFCQAFVKTILNLFFSKRVNKFLSKWSLLDSKVNSITWGYIGFQRCVIEVSSFLGCDSASLRKWFSTYLCIPVKLALLIINFHGSVWVLRSNIGMINKFKTRQQTFTYFQVRYRHKSIILCRCVT